MQHKVFIAVMIFITINQVQCQLIAETRSDDSSILCTSLSQIIKSFASIPTVDIIVHSHKLNCIHKLMERDDKHVYTINAMSMNSRKRSFVIFIADTYAAILDLVTNKMELSKFDVSGHYLILLRQAKQINIKLLFTHLWTKHSMYNVNILALDEIDNIVRMFTFYPFTHGNCHNTEPIQINEFNNDTNEWIREAVYPQKLRDFHKCPIYAAVYAYGPSAQETFHSNGTTTINGSDVEIFRGLADALNFRLRVKILNEPFGWGQIYGNGTVTGALQFLNNGSADLAANFYYLMELRSRYFQFSRAYYSIQMIMIIPRRPQYSALKKLTRPFSRNLWIYSSIVILCCCFVVYIIKKQSKSIQLLFLDKNINAPVLQLLVVLFGSSQHVLPRNDFSRMLLMSFVLFTFVLRSLYVGSLYKFLQSDGRMKDFQTIDELIEHDFDFIVDPTVEDMIKYQKFFSRRKLVNPTEYYNIIDKTRNPSCQSAILSSNDEVIYLNKHSEKGKSFNVLNEVLLTVPTVFYLKKNSYLTNIINEKIDDLLAAGLINYWISKYLDDKYLRVKIEEEGPNVLNFDELFGAFQLLFFGLVCSVIGFVGEVVKVKMKRFRKK